MKDNLMFKFFFGLLYIITTCLIPSVSISATGDILSAAISSDNNSIKISGSILVTEDDTPDDRRSSSPYCDYANETFPANYRPYIVLPGSDPVRAEFTMQIDDKPKTAIINLRSSFSSTNPWTHIGKVLGFSSSINSQYLTPGNHTITLTLQDIYGVSCYRPRYGYGYLQLQLGTVMDTKMFSYKVSEDGHVENCEEIPIPDINDINQHNTDKKYFGKDSNPKPGQCPINFVGNPVNIFNGNNFEQEIDLLFNSPFKGGLAFKRFYNSQDTSDSAIGFGWTHNYDFVLHPDFGESSQLIEIIGGSGRGIYFEDNNQDGIFKGTFSENSSISKDQENNYVWNKDDGTIYKFEQTTGKLLSITDNSGNIQLLSYNTDNLLEIVTDQASGRSLTFHYNSDNKIDHISGPVTPSVPDGIWVSYNYDANNNLSRVQYTDDSNGSTASGFDYLYEDANDPNNLTTKKDLAGTILSTWTYNANDQAIENVNNKGTGATIDYDTPDEVSVTDAYGITTIYSIAEIAGRKKIIQATKPSGCTSCSDGIYQTSFDATTGFPTQREFFNGRTDLFQNYDENFNPQTTIISQGTAEEKNIQKTYHPRISTPLSVTQKSRMADAGNPDRNHVSIWDYDDPNGPGNTQVPNEAPTARIYQYIEQGYTQDNAGAIIPFEHITAYTYNAKGQVTSVNGPLPGNQDIISFAYDSTTGDLLSLNQPILGTQTFEYDGAGNLIRTVDENNIQTLFSYDGKNRLTQTIRDGVVSGQTYTAAGSVSGQVDGAGRTLTYTYNPKGFLQKIINPAGEYLYYAYDETANRIEESIYSAQGIRNLYKGYDYGDPATNPELTPGKPWKLLQKNQDNTATLETVFKYQHGNLTQITDPLDTWTKFSYDTQNRLTAKQERQTDDITGTTLYAYNTGDNLTGVTDPEAKETLYTYDDANRQVKTVSPDTGTTRFYYDEAGNLISQTLNDGSTIQFAYDATGRLTGKSFADSSQDVIFLYDQGINGKGRLTGISNPTESYAFIYDTRGNLTSFEKTTGTTTFTTTYTYDNAGNVTGILYPNGRGVAYEHDTVGYVVRVTTTKDGNTQVLAENISHLPFGPLTSATLGNNQAIAVNFDLNYRPKTITALGLLDLSYGIDAAGRITGINDQLDSGRSRSFAYDRAGRVTTAVGAFGTAAYTYDKTGNRTSQTLGSDTQTYAYEGGTNRLANITGALPATQFAYDDNGNMTSKGSPEGSTGFVYNQTNRLIQVIKDTATLSEYTYNSFGQRVKKSANNKTVLYHYDLSGNLIGESSPDGDFFMDYVYLGAQRLAAIPSDPDDVFNVRVSTNTGRLIEGVRIYAFTESNTYTGIYGVTDNQGTAIFQKNLLTGTAYKFRADYLNEQFWSALVPLSSGSLAMEIVEINQLITVTQNSSTLGGIRVYVFDENNRYLGINGVTDENGQITFALPGNQAYKYRADILGTQFFSDVTPNSGDAISIDSQGGTLTFTVNKGENLALANVKAYLFSESGTYLGKSGTTDANGITTFNVPTGNYKIRCDYLGYQFWTPVVQVATDQSASLLIPHTDCVITVNKTYQSVSDPAVDIKTYLFSESGTYLGVTATTNAAGQAVFPLPNKPYKVRADYMSIQYWSPAFTGTDQTIAIDQGAAKIALTNIGIALADVKIYVFNSQGTYLGITAQTDATGNALFILPAGNYKFRADFLNNQYWSDVAQVTANQESVIPLSTGGGSLTLTVKKSAQDILSGIKGYLFSESGTYLGQNALTDSSGQISFTLGNGSYKIRLDHMGYEYWTPVFTIPDTAALEYVIPHTQVTTTVQASYNGQTRSLANIKTYLFSESGTYLGIQTTTNETGQATFTLPDKAYKIRADYLAMHFWSDPFTGTDQTIEIPEGEARVQVSQGASLLENVKIYLFNDQGTYMGIQAVTDAAGIALFQLPQATWKFRADYLNGQCWASQTITPNQATSVPINTGGGPFALTLEKAPGIPLTNVKIYAFSGSGTYLGLSKTSDTTGSVSFDIPDGDYKFRADYLGYKFWTEPISIPVTSSLTLAIPHKDVVVTVQSRHQSLAPLQGAKTSLFTAAGSYQGVNTITNANGQAVFNLPEQAYKIRADYLSAQYWSEELTQTDADITIDHGKALINVTQSDQPISSAKVYLFSASGSYLGQSGNTDTDGNTGFTLPVNQYKFRVDHNGTQYWSDPVNLVSFQETPINLNLDLLALNLTANPQYARYDGEMPKKEKQTILLASIGSLAGYLDNGTQQTGICYYINDHLGTPIKIIDDQGQVIWDAGYMPFGKTDITVDTAQNNFRFPGQYYDGETGLHYNMHRYYDPDTGRYLTPDPIGLAGGINPFVYAQNNPTNRIDPLGLIDIFGFVEVDAVPIRGLEGAFGFVIDTDNLGESGIFKTVPDALVHGLNFGFSAGLGVAAREIEGQSQNFDLNLGPISPTFSYDDQGLNSIAIGYGQGAGASGSVTYTNSITINDLLSFIKRFTNFFEGDPCKK